MRRLPGLRSCRVVLFLALVAVLVAGPQPASGESVGTERGDPLAVALARADRSELTGVLVRLDYYPARGWVRGRAELDLTLRAGQRRILFHFNPLWSRGPRYEHGLLRRVRLDGHRIDPAELRRVRAARGAEVAFEVRRTLAPGSRHRLMVTWAAPDGVRRADRLFPMFDDTEGPGGETETMWERAGARSCRDGKQSESGRLSKGQPPARPAR